MPSLFSRKAWSATIAVFFFIVLASPFLIIMPDNVKATGPGFISVSGTQFTMDSIPFSSSGTRLVGLDETTAVAMAIRAHVSGLSGEWGKNMNFPVPDTGKLNVNDLTQLWYAYFWFCAHYGLNLVRMSNADQWATEICFEAWRDHPTQYFQVLDEMLKQAYARGIYVELNMAGGCTGTAPNYFYEYGQQRPSSVSDQITDLNKAEGKVYHLYLDYITANIQHLDASPYTNAIFAYDVYNEPDCSPFWAHNQIKFGTWARVIANDTRVLTTHIVDMGVCGGGDPAGNFGWGFASFYNYTGGTGFDICHRHYYASAEDNYLVDDPLDWSISCGKPLLVGEVAKNYMNGNYGFWRWTWYESRFKYYGGQALCTMVLTGGTTGYPYSGDYPIGETPGPPPAAPTISISASVNYGTIPLTVHFTSQVESATSSFTYYWTFGDGGSSTSANPSHTYTTAGTYNVYCTLRGGAIATSNTITVVTYVPTPSPPPAPPTPPPLPPPPPPPSGLTPGPNDDDGIFIITTTNGTNNDIIAQARPFLGAFAFAFAILAVIALFGQVSRF